MRGFTLVEVMVTSVVLAILVVALFLVLSLGQRSWLSADVSIQLRQEISRALVSMSGELSATSPARINLILNNPAGSVTFNIPDTSGDGIAVDTAGDIEWSPAITYSLNAANQIQRSVAGGAVTILAGSITALQFTRIQNEVVRMDLTASKVSGSGSTVQDSGQAVVKLRN
ncbi:MAG: prepilin-type N-terminal cleavage/methylation domain-containing protein [Candidatus Omnitrophota bacterium]